MTLSRRVLGVVVLAALWAAFVMLGAAHGFWRPPLAPRDDGKAFAEAAEVIMERDLVGNAVLVLIEDGEVTATHGVSQGAPVNEATVFQLASLSKWVTAWGVLALVEEGRIGLDVPVEAYLTRWHLPPSHHDLRGVTIRRLLSHTAGLSDDLGYMGFEDPATVQSIEESLTRAADPRPGADGIVRAGAEPGSSWRYSGGGFTLLQLVVEEVTGESFADYLRERVLGPLGMGDSSYALADIDASRLAPAYDEDGVPAPFRHYTALAAASLYSTAADMARFVAAHQPGPNGEPAGRGALRPQTVAAMREVEAHRFGLPIWGLGTMLYAPDGEGSFVIGHEGGNSPAVTTTARFNPATGDGIVVLQTGRPELPARLGAEWVRWQTGRADIVVLGRFAPAYLAAMVAGWVLIVASAILGSRRRRRTAGLPGSAP